VVDTNGTSITYSFTQKTGAVSNVIAKVNLPNYNMVSDTVGSHSHGGASGAAGTHNHTTDAQGAHNHDTGGVNAGASYNGDHNHTGNTDGAGSHAHTVNAWGAVGGGATLQIGSFATGNTITTSTDGYHGHSFTTTTNGGHTHQLYWDGNHSHTTTTIGNHTHGISADGLHAHNISLGGSGTLFPILQPVLVVTKIVFAGTQAATTVMSAMVPEGLASDMAITDELATLRTELAELRAILMPPRSLRVMSSPSRGPH
jgi:hypothetical protein